MRRIAPVLAVSLALSSAACGGGASETQNVSSGSAPPSSSGGEAANSASLTLGRELSCDLNGVRLQVLAGGQFVVDGEQVGVVTADGGFFDLEGGEIGRVLADGRMVFAGAMQDARIDGSQIVAANGTIAYLDAQGALHVVGGELAPAPVIGMTSAHARTFLFAFSMFAALLDTAERMGL